MSRDVWYHLLEPQDSLLRGSEGVLPHPCQPPTLGHIWASGSPSCSALGMSLPSDTITGVFNHRLLRAWPTPLLLGAAMQPQSQPPFLSALGTPSWIIQGLRGAEWVVAVGRTLCFWAQREKTQPSPAPNRAANETLVYDCVSLQSAQLVWGDQGRSRSCCPLGPANSPWGGLEYQKPLGPHISGGTQRLSPALGLLPAARRFVILQVGLMIIIASTYRVLCKCFIRSKTAAIILKCGAEILNCTEYKVTRDADQMTRASPQEDLGNKSGYIQTHTVSLDMWSLKHPLEIVAITPCHRPGRLRPREFH